MRTLINITESQVRNLAILCAATGLPRTKIILRAIDDFVAQHVPQTANKAFGLWGHSSKSKDGLAYQKKVRSEW